MEHIIVTDSCSQMRSEARQALKGRWGRAVLGTFLYLLIVSGGAFIIQGIFGEHFGPFLSMIYSLLVAAPMYFGYLFYLRKISVDQTPNISDLFAGFEKIWKLVRLMLLIYAAIIVSIIIFVIITALVGGFSMFTLMGDVNPFASIGNAMVFIVLLYLLLIVFYTYVTLMYNQVYVVIMDDPEVGVIEALRQSRIRMKGNKGKLFLLMLSFIGWVLIPFILLIIVGIQAASAALMSGNLGGIGAASTFSFLVIIIIAIGSLFLAPYVNTAYMVFSNKLVGTDRCSEENRFIGAPETDVTTENQSLNLQMEGKSDENAENPNLRMKNTNEETFGLKPDDTSEEASVLEPKDTDEEASGLKPEDTDEETL